MIRYKLFPLLLIYITSTTKCEISRKKLEDKSRTNAIRHASKNDERFFISKSTGWIFPPNNASERKINQDQIPASAEFGGYHYLPPPHSLTSDHDKDCSPCNLEPWIPIAGHNKYNNGNQNHFSSPAHSVNSNLNNGYSGLYGTPPNVQYGVPKPQYGPPQQEYGPPKQEYSPPKQEYGPPKQEYGPPKQEYGPPKQEYGPPKQEYGPPKQEYGPPKQEYGPPKQEYGPPQQEYGPPHQEYGPPKPLFGPPKQEYGPPKTLYGPPNPLHGAPPPSSGDVFVLDYMIPPPVHYKLPSLMYGPPKKLYGLPKPLYGAPKPSYGRPKPNYGPPIKPNYGPPPKPNYGVPPKPEYRPPQDFNPPKVEYGPPKPVYGPPPNQDYGLPPSIFNPPPPQPEYGVPPAPVYGVPNKPIFEIPKPDFTIQRLPSPTQNSQSTVLERIPDSFPNINDLQDAVSQNFIPPPQASVDSSQVVDNSDSHLADIPLDNGFIPPPVPSDSYGNPVTGENFEYNPQFDSLPAPSGDNDHSFNTNINNGHQFNLQNPQVHLPNLSPVPALPIYEFRNFKGHQNNDQNVQVQKSVKVADFVASVEHPINIIQSPLVELQINEEPEHNYQNNSVYTTRNAKTHYPENNLPNFSNDIGNFKLSENPIVVEDTHTSATNIKSNVSAIDTSQKRNIDKYLSGSSKDISKINKAQNEADLIKQLLIEKGILGDPKTKPLGVKTMNQTSTFHLPTIDYNNDWVPKYHPPAVSSSMVPPPFNSKSSWVQTSTQKPIQIIVPYTNKIKPTESYTTLVPSYTPPMATENSVWAKFLTNIDTTNLNKVTSKPFTKVSTAVYNIKDLIAANDYNTVKEQLPYDIISLQKNIDDWTHQSFSHEKTAPDPVLSPKQIPADFFTPKTTTYSNDIFDHQSAESSRKETEIDADIETNIIVAADAASTDTSTTPLPTTTETILVKKEQKSSWKSAYVTVSPHSKEKVYVVTPQAYSFVTSSPANAWSMAPKVQNGTYNNVTVNSQRFSVRIEPQSNESREKMQKSIKNAIKVVYSEWPHLINNLQTTTTKPTSGHPLFGLMGITAYTPPPNSTIETWVGHSKVVTVVTPSSKGDKTKDA
ncbi:unnamed protein product [Psylliodes chrysocephalus]|uniref:Uncharacterized protein n=1 Tax=Psylliodes chrysocephalus TaxID=3402493 RepID=A0A9P0GMT2_9CUCU|nr:unnamed protein product [Psylliodes chrysocephala]